MIVNPILQAVCLSISPTGPLAYALLLGGLFLVPAHINRDALSIPGVVVFFSGMFPQTSHFWFSKSSDHFAFHIALVIVGAALTAWWFWRLANLNEEDEGYFVQPMGPPGSMSRLEGDVYRRWQGRKAARSGLWQMLADRWHDRLMDQSAKQSNLADYGWGKIKPEHQAALVCLGFALYGLLLDRLFVSWYGESGHGINIMLYFGAIVIPVFATTLSLRGRRARLAQELLRPASRGDYFNRLFRSMAKQTLLLWLAAIIGLSIAVISNPEARNDPFVKQLASFAIWSLALQFPALAIGSLVARLRSPAAIFLGIYVLIAAATILMFHLKIPNKYGPLVWAMLEQLGTFPTVAATALGLVILSLPLYAWARRSWLNAELG